MVMTSKVLIHLLCGSFVLFSLIINYKIWFKDWGRRMSDVWGKLLSAVKIHSNLLLGSINIAYRISAISLLIGSILIYIFVAQKYL